MEWGASAALRHGKDDGRDADRHREQLPQQAGVAAELFLADRRARQASGCEQQRPPRPTGRGARARSSEGRLDSDDQGFNRVLMPLPRRIAAAQASAARQLVLSRRH